MGIYHVVLTTQNTSPEELTLTAVEIQQIPDAGKTDCTGDVFCLKWTVHNGIRKVCVKFRADTDKLNFVV